MIKNKIEIKIKLLEVRIARDSRLLSTKEINY